MSKSSPTRVQRRILKRKSEQIYNNICKKLESLPGVVRADFDRTNLYGPNFNKNEKQEALPTYFVPVALLPELEKLPSETRAQLQNRPEIEDPDNVTEIYNTLKVSAQFEPVWIDYFDNIYYEDGTKFDFANVFGHNRNSGIRKLAAEGRAPLGSPGPGMVLVQVSPYLLSEKEAIQDVENNINRPKSMASDDANKNNLKSAIKSGLLDGLNPDYPGYKFKDLPSISSKKDSVTQYYESLYPGHPKNKKKVENYFVDSVMAAAGYKILNKTDISSALDKGNLLNGKFEGWSLTRAKGKLEGESDYGVIFKSDKGFFKDGRVALTALEEAGAFESRRERDVTVINIFTIKDQKGPLANAMENLATIAERARFHQEEYRANSGTKPLVKYFVIPEFRIDCLPKIDENSGPRHWQGYIYAIYEISLDGSYKPVYQKEA